MSHIRCLLVAALGLAVGLPAFLATADEEPAKKPEELFKTLDKNSDGKLTKNEVGDEQAKFFERLIRIGDKDDNGELSRDEFIAALQNNEKPVAAPGGLGGEGGRPQGDFDPKRFFEMFDRNKDGKLTKDELPEPARERFAPLFQRLNKEELTLEDLARVRGQFGGGPNPEEFVKRFDKNNDGKVSLDEVPDEFKQRIKEVLLRAGKDALGPEELARAFAAGPAQPERRPEGRPQPGQDGFRGPVIFRKLDTNGDGKISKEELAKAGEQFDDLDANKDGSLDPRELLGPPPEAGRPGQPQPAEGRRFGDGQFIQRLLEQADANKDGKLSEDEAPPRMKERFAQLDKNSDGFLTAEELKDSFSRLERNRPEGNRRPEKKKKPTE